MRLIMEIDLNQEKLCINKLICEKREVVFIEEDMIVPDSKPDILDAINVNGNVCVYKKEVLDGKVRVDGCVNTYIMYIPDSKENNLRGLNATLEFSQEIAISECKEGMQAVISLEIKDLECNVLNGRKINIRAGIEFKIKIFSNEYIDVITGINNIDDIQTLDKIFEVNSVLGNDSARVYLKDTLNIDNQDEIAEILKAEINLGDYDIKISYNKILSKCEAYVKIMYLTEDNRINTVEGKIPAVGFIDMQNVSEETICEINNQINNIIIRPNSAEDHSIYIEIEIETECTAFDKKKIALIQDLYSPSLNLDFSQRNINLLSEKNIKSKIITVTSSTNIPDIKEGKLLDIEVHISLTKEQKEMTKIIYEGEVLLNYIFLNNNGNVNSKVSKMPFEFNIENFDQDNNTNIETKLKIINKKCNVSNNGDIESSIDIEVISESWEKTSIDIIDNIEIKEIDKKTNNYDSLIIYIVQNGDTMWNIAKKFRSTVEDLAKMNEITDTDKIQVGQKIYIPKINVLSRKEKINEISA